jgi:hypothetical protein
MTNSTRYADTAALMQQIYDTCHSAGVDISDCVSVAEITDRVERDAADILPQQLDGHGSCDPALAEWLSDRGADLDAAIAAHRTRAAAHRAS